MPARQARMPARHPLSDDLAEMASFNPEITRRWIRTTAGNGNNDAALSSKMYKTLISLMLRSTSTLEANDTFEVLKVARSFPLEDKSWLLEQLGFPRAAWSTFRSVLGDLLSSGMKNEPLLVTGTALRFYSAAGSGSDDDSEYGDEDQVTNLPRFYSLADARAHNLDLLCQFYTLVMRELDCSVLEDGSIFYRAALRKDLFEQLPIAVHNVTAPRLVNVLRVYGAVIVLEGRVERKNYLVDMRSMFNQLSRQENGGILIRVGSRLLPALPMDVLSTSMHCLQSYVTREEFKGMFSEPMCADIYIYKVLMAVLGNNLEDVYARRSVPGLLVLLTRGWMSIMENDSFALKGCMQWNAQEKKIRKKDVQNIGLTLLSGLDNHIGETRVKDMITVKYVVKNAINRILFVSELV